MRELELKAVVDDWELRRRLVEEAGAILELHGELEDVRYDRPDRSLGGVDHVLRLRVYRTPAGETAALEWKGPTRIEDGYKLREEVGTTVNDAGALREILAQLGFQPWHTIHREIAQYRLLDATIRFERYPALDDLVEVEGEPTAIERAIAVLRIPRASFTTERLTAFARRFEARTGERARLNRDG